MSVVKPTRPAGVTVLGILNIIVGVMALIGGGMILTVGAFIDLALLGAGLPIDPVLMRGAIAVVGVAVLVSGLIGILLGWGLMAGKNLARMVVLIFAVLGVIGSLLSIFAIWPVVLLIIDIVYIWYLTRPHVKNFFKGIAPPAPGGYPPAGAPPGYTPTQAYSPAPPETAGTVTTGKIFCSKCGAENAGDATYCKNCGSPLAK